MTKQRTFALVFILGMLISAHTRAGLLFTISTASGDGSFEIDTSVAPTVSATCGPSGFIFDVCYEDAVTNVTGAALGVFTGTTDLVVTAPGGPGGGFFTIDFNVPPLAIAERFVSVFFDSSADLLSGLPTDPTDFFSSLVSGSTGGIVSADQETGMFTVTSLVTNSVPAPPTWLLLTLGYLVGFGSLRRRSLAFLSRSLFRTHYQTNENYAATCSGQS